MTGLQPAVKWGLEGVSANHNLLEKTVIAALTDTITILSAFGILYTRQPPNLLQGLLWGPLPALRVISALPAVSSVYVTTEGPCVACVMLQDAACAVRVWKGRDASAVDQDTTPSQTARHVAVVEPVWLTVAAVQVASVFASTTMGGRSVTHVHQASMDTQTVLPASVHRKAHMATYATHCQVSACASLAWWVSSVTTVPLDSGSPIAQPPSVSVIQPELRSLILKRAPAAAYQT